MATVKSNNIIHKAGKPYQLTENQKAETMNSSQATAIANEQVIVSNEDKPEAELVYIIPGEFSAPGTYNAPAGKAYGSVKITGGGESKTAAPTFSPEAGNIEKGASVALACEDAGAEIHYTTDGSEPTLSSSTYSSPITVNADMTIKAVAVVLGKLTSDVASAAYTAVTPKVATPTFSPEAGAVAANTEVAISCSTADAEIHYTVDGSEPTAESPVYSAAITIDAAKTIKAIAVKDAYDDSEVATADYTIA